MSSSGVAPSGDAAGGEGIVCSKDKVPLEPGKVELSYQGHTFPVDIMRCPVCGLAYIPEELARGSMLEVEQTLEDK